MTPLRVLVTGATGPHGGAVLAALTAAGHEVSALVRDPGSPRAAALGVGLVGGDLTDRSSLADPFGEADVVYAVTTPFAGGPAVEIAQGEAIIAAAERAGLGWLVLASVAAAQRADVPHFRSKAEIERRVADSSLDWTVVAPSYFFENVAGALDEGRLTMPLAANTPLHQVALDDLGATVASIIGRRDEHLGRKIEIAGDAPTPAKMADALDVELEEISPDDLASTDLARMYRFLAQTGYGIDVQAVRAAYPEVPWTCFAAWADDQRRARGLTT